MKINNFAQFIISIVLAYIPGAAGSVFTFSEIPTWYANLNKPSFNPPNWVFGPVWTTLYTLMGISLYLVWKKGLENKNIAFAFWFFIAQLVVNFLWTFVFFRLHQLSGGFVAISLLWLMIVVSTFLFWKIDRLAAILLSPYLAWVSFASLLNFFLWQLNK